QRLDRPHRDLSPTSYQIPLPHHTNLRDLSFHLMEILLPKLIQQAQHEKSQEWEQYTARLKERYEREIKKASQAFATEKAEMHAYARELRQQLQEEKQESHVLATEKAEIKQQVKQLHRDLQEKAEAIKQSQEKNKQLSHAYATEKEEMRAQITALSQQLASPPSLQLSPPPSRPSSPLPVTKNTENTSPTSFPLPAPLKTPTAPLSPQFTPTKHEKPSYATIASTPPSPQTPIPRELSSSTPTKHPKKVKSSPLNPLASPYLPPHKRQKPYMTIHDLFAKFGTIWPSAPCSLFRWPIKSPNLKSSKQAELRTPNSDQSEPSLAASNSASAQNSPSLLPRTVRQQHSPTPYWLTPALSASSLP
ncbi:MAG: hypothetical protein L6R35_007202, partial [Caloplaca aegaea]